MLALVATALFSLRLISESGCSEFTTERTTVAANGWKINVRPDDLMGSFGVKLGGVPLAEFNASVKDADVRAAVANLPAALTPQSDLLTVRKCSVDPRLITLRTAAPAGMATSRGLDLYGWDSEARTWNWLGGEVDSASKEIVARVNRMPSALMLMKAAPGKPVLGVETSALTGDPSAVAKSIPQSTNEINATGFYLGDNGSLVGNLQKALGAAGWNGTQVKATPVVRNWGAKGEVNRTLLRDMLADETTRAAHVNTLVNLVESGGFDGVEVDYRGVDAAQREAFAQFVELLSRTLGGKGRTLSVAVPAPTSNGAVGSPAYAAGVFDLPGYDLYRIGRAATQVKLDLSTNPAALHSDQLDPLVEWVSGQINRYKLQVVVPTLSVRQDANGRMALIGLEEALAGLGSLQADPSSVLPGSNVQLKWDGVNSADMRYDPATKTYSYSYVDNRGIQQVVWLGTSASLKRALQQLSQLNIRGVTLRGLAQSGNDEGIAQVVGGFVNGDLASVPAPEPVIKVAFGAGTPFSLPVGDAPLVVQAPGGEGTYDLTSTFLSARPVALGGSQVQVSRDAAMAGGGATTATASASVTATTTLSQTPELPAAIAVAPKLPGVNADVFELGGHVNNLTHVAQMIGAGMTWARTESRGFDVPVQFINEAKSKGLKVLITAVGDRNRVMDEAYREEWAQYVGRIAAAGADAIEVWSEPNYEAEWPTGQINGVTYADLLKRAFFGIKQANPNTMVISAGLAQTAGAYSGGCDPQGCDEAAFLSQMATAGVKDYMDCVGIHYTSGYGAPSAVGTNYYTQYYEPLRNAYYGAFNATKPVCFTALGYVTADGFEGGMPSNYSFAAGTTLANQAAWLAEAAQLSKDSGKVRLMIVWNVDSTLWRGDDTSGASGAGTEGDPQAGYALIRPDGTCLACESLRGVMR